MAALAPPAYDLTFLPDDDDFIDWTRPVKPPLPRASTTSYGYGNVVTIGQGKGWNPGTPETDKDDEDAGSELWPFKPRNAASPPASATPPAAPARASPSEADLRPVACRPAPSRSQTSAPTLSRRATPGPMIIAPHPARGSIMFSMSPGTSPNVSRPSSPGFPGSPTTSRSPYVRSPNISRPTTPRPRRRSSQQRVSVLAGRLSLLPVSEPVRPEAPQRLVRSGSARSFLSVAASVGPPTPDNERLEYISGRSMSEFVVERELGRGAYGLVKRAREMNEDGTMGPPLVIKQIFKTRILADCWKRHPKHGTIPIEIYVLNAISSTSYVLPPRRPWDPWRTLSDADKKLAEAEADWVEGKVVKGHPNVCSMLDFFEDDQYYYMVMPSTIPTPAPGQASPPSDLFDLVENHPHGLPPAMIRTYLGQIADALAFLHSKGIVHRDIKDENVILDSYGRAILIDFGSSGLVRKAGWDTFSGTLDYAGPEILRGERYHGKEQDVWAFGVVAFVLLIGECPFTTAAEAQDGLDSPFSNARIALDERCDGHEADGEEVDGGGALDDAEALVRACLRVDLTKRPTFDRILESRFLMGRQGWSHEELAQ